MDHKQFKSDMTYALKKLTKDGKTLVIDTDNLEVVDGKFVSSGSNVEALEALALVKGYSPTPERLQSLGVCYYHEAYGPGVVDAVAMFADIPKSDLYEFWNGLANIEGNDKCEFYKVGTYMREKFAPIGAHKELLCKSEYQFPKGEVVMHKTWIVYNRPLPGGKRGDPSSIIEIEGEIITALEDPSINFLKPGEFKVRVLEPAFLYEETRILKDGALVDAILPPIYYNHSFFESEEKALASAESGVRSEFERNLRKKDVAFTEEEVAAKVTLIKRVHLKSRLP
jgi:hypothetical protein